VGTLRLRGFLPYRLSIAANAVSRVIAAAYEQRFGLSVPEWRLIAVLHEHGSCTQQDLVGLTLMDKVAVSRAAIALAKRRLVDRTPDANDGRARHLQLSKSGQELHRRIAPAALNYEAELLASFSTSEIAALREMLERLEGAAKELADVQPGQARTR
jgi:DNA-binding MarR family transcriptional regulator